MEVIPEPSQSTGHSATSLTDLCNILDTLVGAHWALASCLNQGTELPDPLPEKIRRADGELFVAIQTLKKLVRERGVSL